MSGDTKIIKKKMTEISYKPVRNTCCFNSMCFSHAFLIELIKKKTFKWYMSLLYVGCMKFPTSL
jgi:hypothetical protein